MKTQRVGAAIGIFGAVYLLVIAWTWSWWTVPALLKLGSHAFDDITPFGGTAYFILWGSSGVLGAIVVALGAALYASVGALRWLLLLTGSVLLMAWLVLWSASAHHGFVFGVGGGLILVCFLSLCLDWARMRRLLDGAAKTAADLRLAGYVSFFIAAWGLCGLLGAPIFLLRPEAATSGGTTMAVKVLVCLVLGWGFLAAAQKFERRNREKR